MKSVEERLESFKTWPHSEEFRVNPETLSQAGFYSLPLEDSIDNVCCYQCEKCLDGWERNDDAWDEHVKHSSVCPLTSLDQLNSRVTTFKNWIHLKPTRKSMAAAGFYFYPRTKSDDDDTAVCFQCGLGLDGWEPTDDPMIEHSKRRPDCPYVKGKIALQPYSYSFFLASRPEVSTVKHISSTNSGGNFAIPNSKRCKKDQTVFLKNETPCHKTNKPVTSETLDADSVILNPPRRKSIRSSTSFKASNLESDSMNRNFFSEKEVRFQGDLIRVKSMCPRVDDNQSVAEFLNTIIESKLQAFDDAVSAKIGNCLLSL